MITKLGKELRKLRLDLGITLFEMAESIGVSSSLLSSVETGRKPATSNLIQRLVDRFPAVRAREAEFVQLGLETAKEVRINIESNKNEGAGELALAFARKFETFSPETIEALLKRIR